MRYALLLIATVWSAVAASAEEYKKGPNGGQMLDVAGVDAELMTAGNTVTINVFVPNAAKPVPTTVSRQRRLSSAALIARQFHLRRRVRIC